MKPTDPGSAIESPRATTATLPGTMPIAVPMAWSRRRTDDNPNA
jgi:hypothetical protein